MARMFRKASGEHAAGNTTRHSILDRMSEARAVAARLGFTCLDPDLKGRATKYRFQCAHGHIFLRTLQNVSTASRCPTCELNRRSERLHALAREAGVTCLEAGWLGSAALHRFRCAQGHTWQRQGNLVVLGRAGCPQCVRETVRQSQYTPDGLERLRRFAAEHGGECLSTRYEGVNHVYAFRCAQGHTWRAEGKSVLHSKTWCATCSFQRMGEHKRSKDGLARLRTQAQHHGGQCLSTAYAGVNGRYRFRCGAGHEWETKGARILRGHWCLVCGHEGRRLGIAVAQEMARERGGECLSTEYVNARAKLQWLCHRGHAWSTGLTTIRQGHWCPECAHMNQITNRKSKARKRYLPSPAGDD